MANPYNWLDRTNPVALPWITLSRFAQGILEPLMFLDDPRVWFLEVCFARPTVKISHYQAGDFPILVSLLQAWGVGQ